MGTQMPLNKLKDKFIAAFGFSNQRLFLFPYLFPVSFITALGTDPQIFNSRKCILCDLMNWQNILSFRKTSLIATILETLGLRIHDV